MFAVIETGGKQYKVEVGTIIEIEKLPTEAGKEVNFEKILLLGDDKDTKIGTPTVKGKVTGKVLEHKRGDKIIVFKMKAKKRYQKKQGHRQDITTVEITEIKA